MNTRGNVHKLPKLKPTDARKSTKYSSLDTEMGQCIDTLKTVNTLVLKYMVRTKAFKLASGFVCLEQLSVFALGTAYLQRIAATLINVCKVF